MSAARSSRPRGVRRAFSLAELLLAIFILAIGVISIAAIYPAAIYQQRLSHDDTMGPIVAENALATLRLRLRQDHFGGLEPLLLDHVPPLLPVPHPTTPFSGIAGDWEWRRPAHVLDPTVTAGTTQLKRGTIVIFARADQPWSGDVTMSEIPWSLDAKGFDAATGEILSFGYFPQLIAFTPEERAYPMRSVAAAADASPEYRWEVMFRRFQGRILAAIFVFRVGAPGGGPAHYAMGAAESPLDPALGPVPVRVEAAVSGDFQPWRPGGLDDDVTTLLDNAQVSGTGPGSPFVAADPTFHWQLPGQWILDQNNSIHRVVRGRLSAADGPVTLARPLPLLPDLPSYVRMAGDPSGSPPPVQVIWFMPPQDENGNTLTPVYVTVKEL